MLQSSQISHSFLTDWFGAYREDGPDYDIGSRQTRLPQLAGKQAINHAVAAGSLERHVGTKKALA